MSLYARPSTKHEAYSIYFNPSNCWKPNITLHFHNLHSPLFLSLPVDAKPSAATLAVAVSGSKNNVDEKVKFYMVILIVDVTWHGCHNTDKCMSCKNICSKLSCLTACNLRNTLMLVLNSHRLWTDDLAMTSSIHDLKLSVSLTLDCCWGARGFERAVNFHGHYQ